MLVRVEANRGCAAAAAAAAMLVVRYVEELVQQEVAAGIPSHRVVVAGFSQGGAVALMALRSQLKLAGVVGEGASMSGDVGVSAPWNTCFAHGDSGSTMKHVLQMVHAHIVGVCSEL